MLASSVATDARATQLQLYPNPATDKLHVAADNLAISNSPYHILDAQGRRVRSGTLADGTADVASLQPGMYVLVIHVNGQPITRRFTK